MDGRRDAGAAGTQCPFSTSGAGSRSHPGDLRDYQASGRLLMARTICVGEISITVVNKDVKDVHLWVYPPDGRVTLVAPIATRLDVARADALSKLRRIREPRRKLQSQARETPRRLVERE